MMTSKVTIIYNVIGTFIKNIPLSNLNSIVIVIVKYISKLFRNIYISKKPTKS